jgi:hypothetical protein
VFRLGNRLLTLLLLPLLHLLLLLLLLLQLLLLLLLLVLLFAFATPTRRLCRLLAPLLSLGRLRLKLEQVGVFCVIGRWW